MPTLSDFQRGQIAALRRENLSYREISRRLGIDHLVVFRVWRRYLQTGTMNRQAGSGRPKVTTAIEDRHIVRSALREPARSARRILDDVPLRRRICDRTARNRLHEAGLRSRSRAVVPRLTPRHRQARLEYAREHLRWTDRQWRRVVFSDESRFCLDSSDRRIRCWRRRGGRYDEQNVQEVRAFNGGSVMVWGGIGYDFKTPLVVVPPPGMTAARYIAEILQPHVLPLKRRMRRVIFMQDNARPHVAAICQT